jgi:threonine dehydrogenase-like Zn-dependent dehydrogenase
VHAVRRAEVPPDATVVIVGAGTIGLLTLVATRRLTSARRIVVVAKHQRQAELARRYGASDVVAVDQALGAIRRTSRAFRIEPERSAPFLLGGADIAFECAGSSSSLELTLRTVRGRGRVVLAAMPPSVDLSPVWFREIELVGAYSGAGDFEGAMSLVAEERLQDLVAASYPLQRWRDALEHAYSGGVLGASKVVFDLREAM